MTFDVDIDVIDKNESKHTIKANEWMTTGPEEFTKRSSRYAWQHVGPDELYRIRYILDDNSRPVGRGIIPERTDINLDGYAAITVGGIRTTSSLRGIEGVLLGETSRLARDVAQPIASRTAIKSWADEQVSLYLERAREPRSQMAFCGDAAALGADVDSLIIADSSVGHLKATEIVAWSSDKHQILLTTIRELRSRLRLFYEETEFRSLLKPNVLVTDNPPSLRYSAGRIAPHDNIMPEDSWWERQLKSTFDVCVDKLIESWGADRIEKKNYQANQISPFIDLDRVGDRQSVDILERYQTVTPLHGTSLVLTRLNESSGNQGE